ncbi:hypothetical protein N3K66_006083 [Trichothecium roseum]|uniref:Uncharacterized protein n=1 Tax=Trichothecium roseum TaxID=47278 RepID=A0ACC0V1D5_9HYPO|nr:hypothetical protein N3K66_006083 [Trichothecium roseum]
MDRFSTSRSRLAQATGPAKLEAVKHLVNILCEDIERPVMLQENRDEALEELKLYARDPVGCDALYTESSISMLLHRAFRSLATSTSHRALRVLVNALRLNAGTRQLVIDRGAAVKICDALQKGDWQDEFLYSRILFLLTYDTDLDLDDLIDNHRLANNIVDNIRRHARLVGSQAKFNINLAEEQSLKETLKLLFNVTHYCQDHASAFTPSIAHIVPLLWKKNINPRDPLSDSFGPLVNALLNLDLEQDRLAIFPTNEPKKLVLRLIELLGYSMRAYGDDMIETNTPPLIDLLRKLYGLSLSPSQHAMRDMLLPSAEDHKAARSQPDTTAARLLKFSTNPVTPAMREATSRIYFTICGEDAETFVKVFGSVFSASFLLEQHLPIPMSAEEAYCTSSETSPLTETPRALEIESQVLLERFDVSLQRTGLFDSDAESSVREGTHKVKDGGDQ